MPTVNYLDDSPVFPKDKRLAAAFCEGGLDAERRCVWLWLMYVEAVCSLPRMNAALTHPHMHPSRSSYITTSIPNHFIILALSLSFSHTQHA